MGKAWRKVDLEGGGLQSANLALVRRLKKRPMAYALWLLFPLGAHALYLRAPTRALIFTGLSAIVAVAFFLGPFWLAIAALTVLIGLALYDLAFMEQRLVEVNKQIRMELYLRPGTGAPREFRGRFPDEDGLDAYLKAKEQERAGHQSGEAGASASARRAPSFSEQEAMLREMARRKKDRARGD